MGKRGHTQIRIIHGGFSKEAIGKGTVKESTRENEQNWYFPTSEGDGLLEARRRVW